MKPRIADEGKPMPPGFSQRAGSIALPLFALAWLALIYAGMIGGDLYVPGVRLDTTYYFDTYVPGSMFGRQAPRIVASVDPAAARAGVRPGMELDTKGLSYPQYCYIQFGARYGTVVTVPLLDRGVSRRFELRADWPNYPSLADKLVEGITMTFCLLMSAFLGYRKPGIMSAALIAFFGLGGFDWICLLSLTAGLPDPLVTLVVFPMSVLCDLVPLLLLAAVAIRVPGDDPPPRKRVAIRAIDVAILAGILVDALPGQSQTLRLTYIALSVLLVVAASVLALRFSRKDDRARIGIVFAGLVFGGIGYAVAMIMLTQAGNLPPYFFDIVNVSLCLIPLAITYAIVKHRVFDITFVLNRTLVYGVTSLLVLLAFGALEFVAERYLSELSHAQSVAVDFAIALGVIVGARTVHRRVDRVVDSVLFRARHEQELALRRFATTAQFYTAQAPLVRDTLEALVRSARVRHAAVYVSNGRDLVAEASTFASAPAGIDENDPSLVEMRAHHEPVDTHDGAGALPGVRAYPMVLAGRILGVIATGEREGGEAMPPDIDDAIRRVGDSLASALAAIETDRIREKYLTLQQRFETLNPAT